MFCKFYWRYLICFCCTPPSMQTHVSLNWILKRAPSEISMVIKIVNLKMLAWCFDACEVYEAVGRKKNNKGTNQFSNILKLIFFLRAVTHQGRCWLSGMSSVQCYFVMEKKMPPLCASSPLQHRQGTRAVVVDSCDWQVV